ncbi:MAG TPA: dTDP-4-dehydrorhamnose reductase [Actinomycetota bacterium]|nr:dTDP-4-dehydrorhamnose reductase [Actinomycetota bacterium]
MRIAVTGAGGGLGRAFLDAVPSEHDVHPFTRRELDVRSFEDVTRTLDPIEPDVIMHFAAMTSVDGCQAEPQRAAETNVLGSFAVAASARRTGAVLVVLSTDYVFDGEKGEPYVEDDLPNPLSVYAWTKLAGERAAQAVVPDALVVRTAWVYGAGDDFVSRAVRRVRDGEEVGAITDQVGSPTHVAHLAERLLPLAASGVRGIVHVAGPEPTTWHDVLVRARELGGLAGTVLGQKAGELARPAPRPANSSLASAVLDRTGVSPMPPLDDGLRKVLTDVG